MHIEVISERKEKKATASVIELVRSLMLRRMKCLRVHSFHTLTLTERKNASSHFLSFRVQSFEDAWYPLRYSTSWLPDDAMALYL